jgi:hypothetical protein
LQPCGPGLGTLALSVLHRAQLNAASLGGPNKRHNCRLMRHQANKANNRLSSGDSWMREAQHVSFSTEAIFLPVSFPGNIRGAGRRQQVAIHHSGNGWCECEGQGHSIAICRPLLQISRSPHTCMTRASWQPGQKSLVCAAKSGPVCQDSFMHAKAAGCQAAARAGTLGRWGAGTLEHLRCDDTVAQHPTWLQGGRVSTHTLTPTHIDLHNNPMNCRPLVWNQGAAKRRCKICAASRATE